MVDLRLRCDKHRRASWQPRNPWLVRYRPTRLRFQARVVRQFFSIPFGFLFRGSFALRRAASVFFFDLTLPPLRPNNAAALLICFTWNTLANRLANCQL